MDHLVLTLPIWNDGILFCEQNIRFIFTIALTLIPLGFSLNGSRLLSFTLQSSIVAFSAWCGLSITFQLLGHPLLQFGLFALILTTIPTIILWLIKPVLSYINKRPYNQIFDFGCSFSGLILVGMIVFSHVVNSYIVTGILVLDLGAISYIRFESRYKNPIVFKTYDDLFKDPVSQKELKPKLKTKSTKVNPANTVNGGTYA